MGCLSSMLSGGNVKCYAAVALPLYYVLHHMQAYSWYASLQLISYMPVYLPALGSFA